MAYQDVFVTITDINGSKQSYSCRKKVYWVTTDVYFSNGAKYCFRAHYNPEGSKEPIIDIETEKACSLVKRPVVLNLTDLLGTDTVLRFGKMYIDLRELAQRPDEVLKRIVAQQLSA
jgi:hypothetical protein